MATLSLTTLVRQNPDQVAAEADGEVLMMHIESGTYYGLNDVGSFIWKQLTKPRTIQDVCEAIQSEFEVDANRCAEDAMTFLQSMVEDGLVDVIDASRPG